MQCGIHPAAYADSQHRKQDFFVQNVKRHQICFTGFVHMQFNMTKYLVRLFRASQGMKYYHVISSSYQQLEAMCTSLTTNQTKRRLKDEIEEKWMD